MTNKKLPHLSFFPFILSIFVFLPIVSILIFTFLTTPNTYLLDKDFSLLSKKQSQNALQDFSLPQKILIKRNGQTEVKLSTASISATIDTNSTVDQLFTSSFKNKILFTKTQKYFLKVHADNQKFEEFLDNLEDKVYKPFIPSEITISKTGHIDISQGSLGQSLDKLKLKQDILFQLSGLDDSPITISLDTVGKLPDQDQIDNLISQSNILKNKQIILNISQAENYTIDSLTLVSWLDFYSKYNNQKITDFINDLNQSLKTNPQDAVFEFEDNKVKEFKPSLPGRFIAQTNFYQSLVQSIDHLLQSKDVVTTIDIPFTYIDPIVRNQDANNLGIKELLGQGKSTFSHSSTIRNKNVQRGAEVINRILVPPGEIFSFNQNLGEVTLENGYQMAYIIRQGRTELDVGGGICQVSTTLFRAALNSGLDIVERQPHAYRVSYYEEDSDPGFDATVFLPSPDLKFKNTTDHHILIQSLYDGTKKSLVYQIYGTSDGRKVTIDNYKKWGYTQAPPDKFIDDPTLPTGKLIQEEHSVPGLKTAFDWTVEKDGQILHQQTFSSSYTPWPAVYRRGTGPTQ